MGFLDELYSEHSESAQQRVANELGLTPDQAARALPEVVPVILSGLKKQLEHTGAEAMESRIVDLDQNGVPDDHEGLLGLHSGPAVARVAGQLGISKDIAAKLIPMLAPFVISMLSKRGSDRSSADGNPSPSGSGIASILDRNGDGSILDDLTGMLSAGAGRSVKGGCIGTVLGFISKGKR